MVADIDYLSREVERANRHGIALIGLNSSVYPSLVQLLTYIEKEPSCFWLKRTQASRMQSCGETLEPLIVVAYKDTRIKIPSHAMPIDKISHLDQYLDQL